MEHEYFMKEAIKQARKTEKLMEVPIGCVIVHEDKIIARGYNRRNTDQNTTSHAGRSTPLKRQAKAGRLMPGGVYNVRDPNSQMCRAIVQARIDQVVIGCMNPKAGCAGSILNLLDVPEFNHQASVVQGVLEEECSEMMSSFFRQLRKMKKASKNQ